MNSQQIVPKILIKYWQDNAVPVVVNGIKMLVPGDLVLEDLYKILKRNNILDEYGFIKA